MQVNTLKTLAEKYSTNNEKKNKNIYYENTNFKKSRQDLLITD